ncbi:MAG: hypothetical protein JRI58_00045 [Deltaproteobacteria bacterium]|nr:hypothetical protein [Deltaproteobacteria bacterium]MBW2073124.1 hypothetical protein [Deltaproteobacteria bacterium]
MEELISEIDKEKEPELYKFLKKIPDNEKLTLGSIGRVIETGSGFLTETELLFLFVEAVAKSARGEEEW